jgi:hypothetical protein
MNNNTYIDTSNRNVVIQEFLHKCDFVGLICIFLQKFVRKTRNSLLLLFNQTKCVCALINCCASEYSKKNGTTLDRKRKRDLIPEQKKEKTQEEQTRSKHRSVFAFSIFFRCKIMTSLFGRLADQANVIRSTFSDIEKAVIKATRHNLKPPKEKHVRSKAQP